MRNNASILSIPPLMRFSPPSRQRSRHKTESSPPSSLHHASVWQLCGYAACFYVAYRLYVLCCNDDYYWYPAGFRSSDDFHGGLAVAASPQKSHSQSLSSSSAFTPSRTTTTTSLIWSPEDNQTSNSGFVASQTATTSSFWDYLWPTSGANVPNESPSLPLHFLLYNRQGAKNRQVDDLMLLVRSKTLPKDLHVSIVSPPTLSKAYNSTYQQDSYSSDNDTMASKYQALISTLETLAPDSWVVLSMDDDDTAASLNHHIRSETEWVIAVERARTILMNLQSEGSRTSLKASLQSTSSSSIGRNVQEDEERVFVSSTSECCAPSLQKAVPGSTVFFAHGPSKNSNSTLGTNEKDGSSSPMDVWRRFMQERAAAAAATTATTDPTKATKSVYLDGTLLAGTARHLMQLLHNLLNRPKTTVHGLDEHAILADYWYQFPHRLVLDYDHELFGPRFDGVKATSCRQNGADTTTQTPIGYVRVPPFERSNSPLFLHSSRTQKDCRDLNTKSLPVWDEDAGVSIRPILDHVDQVFVDDVSVDGIDRHFDKEILYIFDRQGLWGTDVRRDEYRVVPTEAFLVRAHNKLLQLADSSDEDNAELRDRWSTLYATVHESSSTSGFPYWAWYGDWKQCNYQNMGNESIPLFTTCAPVACNHSFPTPSYMNIIEAQPDTIHWYKVMAGHRETFPWESKVRKVVWRGTLSENTPSKVFDSQRWRLCKFVHELTDPAQKAMFDVGLTNIPEFMTAQIEINASIAGGVIETIPMQDFQKSTIVLDMDGSSWSSRFGTLLCYNSAVMKVEPAYVDDWFYSLIPWKHYIPVKNDLSDLLETTAFVLDPANDALIQEIIASANHWCSVRLTEQGLVNDMLDTWERYIRLLDRADPNWRDEWAIAKDALFAPSSNLTLVALTENK